MGTIKRNNLVFPSLIDEMFKPDWFGGIDTSNKAPAVNVLETDENFEMELFVPGRKKEDFTIAVEKVLLTVSAEDNLANTEGKFTRKEFEFKAFKRVFSLPETVDTSEISVEYNAGILKFVLPKKEKEIVKKRLIEIN